MTGNKDALLVVFSRNAFYRRLHFLALGAVCLASVVLFFLIWMLIYLYRHPTEPLYFSTDKIGRLVNVIPPSVAGLSFAEVVEWTNEAVQASYSYDYINYHAQLQSAQRYFTPFGWSTYMRALTFSGNLRAVDQRKLITVAQVVSEPKILGEGILQGAYAWKLEMQVLLLVMQPPYDGSTNYSNPLDVTIIVQRQPILQSYKGLAIAQVLAKLPIQAPPPPQQ